MIKSILFKQLSFNCLKVIHIGLQCHMSYERENKRFVFHNWCVTSVNESDNFLVKTQTPGGGGVTPYILYGTDVPLE